MKPRALLAEFIGTFALIFVGVLSIEHLHADGAGLIGIALAHGLTIATMVWATASISGGQLNPAVSFALWISKKIDFVTFLGYVIAQLAGGITAAWLITIVSPAKTVELLTRSTPALGPNVTLAGGIILEAVATFFLLFVIFSTSLDKRQGRMAALFIGLTVTLDILAIGPYTGGAMNPARYFGPAIVLGDFSGALVFTAGPLLGAALVWFLFATPLFQPEEVLEEDEVVSVEHVPPAEPHVFTHEPAAQLAEPEPTISQDPPRYLTYTPDPQPTHYVPVGASSPTFTEPGITADGRINFTSIYRMANLPDVPFTAEQVLEMVNSLPADLPMESKRTAIRVTLQTMAKTTGASVDTVISDAKRKVQALASFAETYTEQANQYIMKTQHEMETMEAEIERRQRGIEEATSKQTQMVEACQSEADRIEKVFDFFDQRQ
jgi:aquaporin Z